MKLSAGLIGVAVAAAVFAASSSSAHAEEANTESKQPKTVVVQVGDTLSKIAEANTTTYPRLFDANTQIQDPDVIYAGDTLRIPLPDEQLAPRALSAPVQAPTPKPQNSQAAAPKPRPINPRAASQSAPVAQVAVGDEVWDRLARCESGGNWSINTGNGYYGGLQFTPGSWRAAGGSGLPHQASREEQIARGKILQARQGWGAWPACTRKLGIR